jgi:hypothetical protein
VQRIKGDLIKVSAHKGGCNKDANLPLPLFFFSKLFPHTHRMSPVLHDLSLSHAANKRLAAAVGDRQIQRGTGRPLLALDLDVSALIKQRTTSSYG